MARRAKRAALAVAVLIGAALLSALLYVTRPEPQKEPVVDRGLLVETRLAEAARERFEVRAQGSVVPAAEVAVQPQVSGRVVSVDSRLVPGGVFSAGEVMFAIDPRDYRLALETARTQLAEAEAQLALERGRRQVAEREWALFSEETDEQRDAGLALREPQLRSAEAAVAAAQARVAQAELDLERTEVRAPFDALVLSESVDLGQAVSPQSQLARLVSSEVAWVRAAMPVGDLALIELPEAPGARGSPALVVSDSGRRVIERRGYVLRRLGDLDPAGQLARVVVAVEDPLALEGGVEPLLFGSYVDVIIEGNREADVVEVHRSLVHNGNEVYVYDDGVLDIRKVDIEWRRPETVLVGRGIDGGELLVASPIATPVEGMKLRLADRPASAPTASAAQ